MKAIILFRDGTRKVIVLDPVFNTTTRVRQGHKDVFLTPKQKAEDLSNCIGYRPFTIDIMDEGESIIHLENPKNAPYKRSSVKPNNLSYNEIKVIKRQFKNYVFTTREKMLF